MARIAAERASLDMVVQLTRFVFSIAGALAGLAVSNLIDWAGEIGLSHTYVIIVFIILGTCIGYLLGGIIGRELTRQYERIEEYLKDFETTDLILAAAGLVVGLLVAMLVSSPLRLINDASVAFLAMTLLFGLCAYVGIRVALTRRLEVGRAFSRINSAKAEPDDPAEISQKYLDTCAVIDGRFIEMRRDGLIEGTMRVPTFVLAELQTLADSADDIKRARGRRGLDLLETLGGRGVEIFDVDYPDTPGVDAKLVRLVGDAGGTIVTVDANLTKVARVQGLKVLNTNEVAAALKPNFLPGEVLRLAIVKQGKEPEQGVGYLEDGTMVVVAGASELVGSEVDTVVTSVLQTAIGRMVFTRVMTA